MDTAVMRYWVGVSSDFRSSKSTKLVLPALCGTPSLCLKFKQLGSPFHTCVWVLWRGCVSQTDENQKKFGQVKRASGESVQQVWTSHCEDPIHTANGIQKSSYPHAHATNLIDLMLVLCDEQARTHIVAKTKTGTCKWPTLFFHSAQRSAVRREESESKCNSSGPLPVGNTHTAREHGRTWWVHFSHTHTHSLHRAFRQYKSASTSERA